MIFFGELLYTLTKNEESQISQRKVLGEVRVIDVLTEHYKRKDRTKKFEISEGKQKKKQRVWDKANGSQKRKKINEKKNEKSILMRGERTERKQCNKDHKNIRNPP